MSSPEPAGAVPTVSDVVVAGGGPVGLATAVELGRRGVDVVVVEPRERVSHLRPRCKTVNVRTMEHLRRWGIAEDLRARAPIPVGWSQDVAFCTTLTGHELSRFHGVLGLVPDGDRFPELGQQAPQYVLEELLRDTVRSLPRVRLVTGASVETVEQDDAGMRVGVRLGDGSAVVVRASYLVGADGPRSTVRQQVGAAYVGEHALRPNFGMVVRITGLDDRLTLAPAVQYWVVNDTAPALMGPLDLDGTWWVILFGVDEPTGRARGGELVRAAVGADLDVTVVSTDPWVARMQLVDHARRGRVFLAGDAAHLNPPFGGHGLNTGIGDAVDLGWKLAAVLLGWGGERLLESYEAERRPVQDRVIAEATANMSVLSTELTDPDLEADGPAGAAARHRADRRIQETKHAEFHALDLVLDAPYASDLLVPPQGDALVGRRLPHLWLAAGRSVQDVLGDGFSLLQLDDCDVTAWVGAAARLAVPLRVVDLRAYDLPGEQHVALVLVRPDHYVAWAGDTGSTDPTRLLTTTTGRTTP